MTLPKDKGETTSIDMTMQEIYSKLCPACQEKMQALIKDKLTDAVIKEALEGKK